MADKKKTLCHYPQSPNRISSVSFDLTRYVENKERLHTHQIIRSGIGSPVIAGRDRGSHMVFIRERKRTECFATLTSCQNLL